MNRALGSKPLFRLANELCLNQIRLFSCSSGVFPTKLAFSLTGLNGKAVAVRQENPLTSIGSSGLLQPIPRLDEACLSCRHMSRQIVQWERMRKRRPLPRKDISAHYPDYVLQSDPNQDVTDEIKSITKDTIAKVNQQISERSYGRLFAVIQVAGKQFKITAEDIIIVQGFWAPQVGDQIRLEKVLLVGGTDFSLLGRPLLPKDLVQVEATIIEKTLSFTKLHYFLRPRKRHRRLRFYRIPYTMVRINTIEFDGLVNERKDVEGERSVRI